MPVMNGAIVIFLDREAREFLNFRLMLSIEKSTVIFFELYMYERIE